jgi:hypothetical protein
VALGAGRLRVVRHLLTRAVVTLIPAFYVPNTLAHRAEGLAEISIRSAAGGSRGVTTFEPKEWKRTVSGAVARPSARILTIAANRSILP